ncbi:hypothetical protein [Methylobacterium radiotolerans]|uniref:hypothetical protein n=1 Tax=Methylobacterium radiotolerans TaxID=31998 RepID=UPI001F4021BC|nr:hypothetical protein [Methylobacterium radiotolerans]UIY45827.1 hypothetical protein LZ599_32490 [Methylobacterium radiotolerans]
MLKPTECLAWDGIAFRPIPCERVMLPGGARVCAGAHLPVNLTPEALRSYALAMRVNPQISAFLGAGVEAFSYREDHSEYVYEIMLEHYGPDFADNYAPVFHRMKSGCLCFHEDYGRHRNIYASTKERIILAILYHELFHTIYMNVPEKNRTAIEQFGANIRARNLETPLGNPDSRSVVWLSKPEEAEAWAFQNFATGRPMPFGLRLPFRVRATFQAALRGDYAHHRVLP